MIRAEERCLILLMNLLIGLLPPIISYSGFCSVRLNGNRSRDGLRWDYKHFAQGLQMARLLGTVNEVLQSIPECLLPNIHTPRFGFILQVWLGGEEIGVVCSCSGSGISQNQTLLTTSCVILAEALSLLRA